MRSCNYDTIYKLTTEQLIDLILDRECECRILKLSNKVTNKVYFEINDLTCKAIDLRGALQFYILEYECLSEIIDSFIKNESTTTN